MLLSDICKLGGKYMKITINAKVVRDFNDVKNNYHHYEADNEENNKIMNMPIERFNELKAKGFVEKLKESKKKTDKSK